MEMQRRQGLKFAESFATLDGLHDEFAAAIANQEAVLGEFRDLIS